MAATPSIVASRTMRSIASPLGTAWTSVSRTDGSCAGVSSPSRVTVAAALPTWPTVPRNSRPRPVEHLHRVAGPQPEDSAEVLRLLARKVDRGAAVGEAGRVEAGVHRYSDSGWRAARSDTRDYFLAGDGLPWYAIGGSIIAANISTEHFIGMIGVAYAVGFVVAQWEWGNWFTFSALIWIFLPYYIRGGLYTMPEFLERRYNATCRYLFAVCSLVLWIVAQMAVVMLAGGQGHERHVRHRREPHHSVPGRRWPAATRSTAD